MLVKLNIQTSLCRVNLTYMDNIQWPIAALDSFKLVNKKKKKIEEPKSFKRPLKRISQYSLLKFPFAIVKGTDLPGLEPAGDAMEMERMLQSQKKYTIKIMCAVVVYQEHVTSVSLWQSNLPGVI